MPNLLRTMLAATAIAVVLFSPNPRLFSRQPANLHLDVEVVSAGILAPTLSEGLARERSPVEISLPDPLEDRNPVHLQARMLAILAFTAWTWATTVFWKSVVRGSAALPRSPSVRGPPLPA